VVPRHLPGDGALDRIRPFDDVDTDAVGTLELRELGDLVEFLAPGPFVRSRKRVPGPGGASVSCSTDVFDVCHSASFDASVR
jgi:hypothetical protein